MMRFEVLPLAEALALVRAPRPRLQLVPSPGLALTEAQETAFERAHQRGPIVCLYTHDVLGLTHATCSICQRLRAEGRRHACTSNPWET
jgi:hypothetical protein